MAEWIRLPEVQAEGFYSGYVGLSPAAFWAASLAAWCLLMLSTMFCAIRLALSSGVPKKRLIEGWREGILPILKFTTELLFEVITAPIIGLAARPDAVVPFRVVVL